MKVECLAKKLNGHFSHTDSEYIQRQWMLTVVISLHCQSFTNKIELHCKASARE